MSEQITRTLIVEWLRLRREFERSVEEYEAARGAMGFARESMDVAAHGRDEVARFLSELDPDWQEADDVQAALRVGVHV